MRKGLIILGCILFSAIAVAQNRYKLSGIVSEKKSGEKIEMVAIQLKELNRWTTSNMKGEFTFDAVPQGAYTLQASCLGFAPYEKKMVVTKNVSDFELVLEQLSLGLEEVIIVAKENTSLSSSSKIESTALEHVQPNSLADVMQLIPGQVTLNPDMSSSNQIAIRDINTAYKPDNNSAMGTAIIVDGSPVSNDANMQTLNTAGGGVNQGYSTAGQGVDLRQIATDNIESVEVIRGIPSVEYGNLTTGAVLVKTKAGKTKWFTKLKADPNIKQLAVSKGFLLPGFNNGAVNIDVDYTKAYDDIREPSKSYQRITGLLGYSKTFFSTTKPLSLNVKLNYFQTLDDVKNDPDLLREEIIQEKEKSYGIKLFGKWSVQKPWLTNLSYNFSGDYKNQEVYEYKVTALSGATVIPISTVSGESEAQILPSRYMSELTIDGKPYNFFGSIKANVIGKYGKINNNLMFGAEWRTNGNQGDGRIYDPTKPPSGATSTRPRAFKDIPASRDLALYLEDKIEIPIGKTNLVTQAGLRYNNMQPRGIFTTDGYLSLEPRVNANYEIIKAKTHNTFRDFALRFGYGLTSKNPPVIYLYPDKSYRDEIGFNYYPDLVVTTTLVNEDTSNPDLKLTKNTKWEAGIDMNVKGIQVMVTGFVEHLKDGWSYESQYYIMHYKKWTALEGAGKKPYFQDGDIYYTENNQIKKLSYTFKVDFDSYLSPKNTYNIDKKGIEYVIDFGKIKAIRSGFRIDGAYYHITKIEDMLPTGTKMNFTYLGDKFPYLPIYPGEKGTVKKRLNTDFSITTHIPVLKMVISTNAQVVWLDKYFYTWENNDRSVAYSLTTDNQKLYGVYEGVDKIYIDPIGFYDKQMVYHPWQDNYSFTDPYRFMVDINDHDYFEEESYPISWQINLKLTKEIGDKVKLSFFANNILDQRPLHKFRRSDSYTRRNQPSYFGAELKFSL